MTYTGTTNQRQSKRRNSFQKTKKKTFKLTRNHGNLQRSDSVDHSSVFHNTFGTKNHNVNLMHHSSNARIDNQRHFVPSQTRNSLARESLSTNKPNQTKLKTKQNERTRK